MATEQSKARRNSAAVVCAALVSAAAAVAIWRSGAAETGSAVSLASTPMEVTLELYTNVPSQTGLIWVDNNNGNDYQFLPVGVAGTRQLKVPGGDRARVRKLCLCATSQRWGGSLAWVQQFKKALATEGGRGKQTYLSYGGSAACQPYTFTGGLRPKLKAGRLTTYDRCGLKTWTVSIQNEMRTNYLAYLRLAADSGLSAHLNARLQRSQPSMVRGVTTINQALLVRGLDKHFCVCAESGKPRFTGSVTRVIAPKKHGSSTKTAYLYPWSTTGSRFDVNRDRVVGSKYQCAVFEAKESGRRAGFALAGYFYSCPAKLTKRTTLYR